MGKRKIIAQNGFERRFLDLYLDPFLLPVPIMRCLGISRATYFRLTAELPRPVRVGLMQLEKLPSNTPAILRMLDAGRLPPGFRFHFNMARVLSRELQVRFECRAMTFGKIHEQLRTGKLDLSLAAMSKIPGRSFGYDSSNGYLSRERPRGVLLAPLKPAPIRHPRPVLGILKDSLHDTYVTKHEWKREYRIIRYVCMRDMTRAVAAGTIDRVFTHPAYVAVPDGPAMVAVGKSIEFGGYTAAGVSGGRHDLLSPLNCAIERLQEQGVLQEFEDADYGPTYGL